MSTNPKKAEFPKGNWSKPNIYANNRLNKDRPEARELANIFLVSPEKAPESEEYKYIKPGYAEVLNDKYNFTGTNKEIKKDWSGFAFSKYSALSKKASAFPDLQNQIRSYYDPATRQFKKDKLEVNFAKDSNLNYALGHATILTPTIDSNGYFHGILFDKYDFDALYKNYAKDFGGTYANNHFYALQQVCKNKNFYVLAPISFKW